MPHHLHIDRLERACVNECQGNEGKDRTEIEIPDVVKLGRRITVARALFISSYCTVRDPRESGRFEMTSISQVGPYTMEP
jgi:hypothetical protein